jgi:RNA polymerase sigma-70 factor (ECF subfamily)
MTDPLALAHRTWARALWALCYRMMGVAADADELVQDTFVRALEARPRDTADEPLRPWLFSIATRLCVDRLRRRRAQGYRGPWLPSPVPDEALGFEAPASARYEVMESASVAFLLALEALSPEQRAALVLGDVFDLPAKEIATHLQTSEANVRQLQHRGRAALVHYDASRVRLDEQTRARTREALEGFLGALATGDVAAARGFLSPEVQTLNDGAGVFHSAKVPIRGIDRAVLFFSRLLQLRGLPVTAEVRALNGLWAFDATFSPSARNDPPRAVTGVLLDQAGRIAVIYAVVAPAKLTAL